MIMRNKLEKSILRVLTIGMALAAMFATTSQPLRAQATHVTQDWAQTPPAFDNGDSLRDFEARLRSSLFLLKAQPEINEPLKLTGTVTAIGRTGIRRLRIRNFQLLSDGGRESGEFNLGAGSWPSVVSALGSALAGDYLVQAAVKDSPIDDLELVFTSKPGTAPSQSTGTQSDLSAKPQLHCLYSRSEDGSRQTLLHSNSAQARGKDSRRLARIPGRQICQHERRDSN